MSRVLPFKCEYLPSSVNILNCLSVERKCRLVSAVAVRPWAAGLNRLLAERRLKKGELAQLAKDEHGKPMRPGTISSVLNPQGPPPKVGTLLQLIDGFAAYDRLHPEHRFPPVELWEFFVSDEQSEALRARDASARGVEDLRSMKQQLLSEIVSDFAASAEKRIDERLRVVGKKR